LPVPYVTQLWVCSAVAAAAAWTAKAAIPEMHPLASAVLVLGPYGIVFVATALGLRIPEATSALARIRRLGR
jgi:hypothetical protein